GPTFRHQRFPQYKATRVKADQELYDQIPLVYQLVEAFKIPIYTKPGYEADDVIGTIIKKSKEQRAKSKTTLETFIVTGDMDTLQLVDEDTKVYTLRQGLSDTVVYDVAAVKKRFGFGPELMVDYKALRGDPSDNIPGVPGIGEKTAAELIQKIGGIKKIYQEVKDHGQVLSGAAGSKISQSLKASVIKKLTAGEESAWLSRELAQIDTNVPGLGIKLKDCQRRPWERAKILDLFKKFEFLSLLKRVPGWEPEAASQASPARGAAKKKSAAPGFVFQEVKARADLDNLLKLLELKKQFAATAVTSAGDGFNRQPSGLILVVDNEGFYLSQNWLADVLSIFREANYELIGHDLKQLIKILQRAGTVVNNQLSDIMVASYLLNPGSRAHEAAAVVLKVLGKELVASAGQAGLFGADYRLLAEELHLLAQAGEQLRQELIAVNNYELFQTIEMPLIPVLAEMELTGVAIDKEKLAVLSRRVRSELEGVSQKIYQYAGGEFNIASPLQLREVLFDKLQIPVTGIKKGKTGLSTAAEQLEKMRGWHPIIEEITNWRELAKLQNTYIDVLPSLMNPHTGRIHTSFNQAVTATGRLSSSDPNLQNIPVRTTLGREIREAFIAAPGNILVSADYSQIELRIVASLAEDQRLMEIFQKGEDVHAATAAAINGVPLDQVTKEMRRAAKEINFGILYGMGAYGLSWRADLSPGEAQEFIARYFREFSGVKKYIEQTLAQARKDGYCQTLFGRRRYIPELNSNNFQLRAAAERMAINHPIQGTAADLMKLGMIKAHQRLRSVIPTPSAALRVNSAKRSRGIPLQSLRDSSTPPTKSGSVGMTNEEIASVKFVLQVHDELVLEVSESQAGAAGRILKKTMEGAVKLRVPVVVQVSAGKNWGDLQPLI
ncbi:MAG: DNA polymerase I, partial [Candidatus Magasanikbacteria bacterium]|nr:DNA polymerase I [Candidatus Magasanikbacteria bacterium]